MKNEKSLCFVIALVFSIPLMILKGWVLSIYWGWFVVPTFQVKSITIPLAIALGALCQFTCNEARIVENDEINLIKTIKTIVSGIVRIFFLLGIGWVLKGFM